MSVFHGKQCCILPGVGNDDACLVQETDQLGAITMIDAVESATSASPVPRLSVNTSKLFLVQYMIAKFLLMVPVDTILLPLTHEAFNYITVTPAAHINSQQWFPRMCHFLDQHRLAHNAHGCGTGTAGTQSTYSMSIETRPTVRVSCPSTSNGVPFGAWRG